MALVVIALLMFLLLGLIGVASFLIDRTTERTGA